MAAYKQFLTWRDKLPVNPATGAVCNAHDPTIWSDASAVEDTGLPLAFVFSDNDPYFFLDIDDCMTPEGVWSHTAVDLCQTFRGCAVEVSQSGKGLHIFGRIPENIPHGNRCAASHCEFYTSKRFVALTGIHAMGDVDFIPDAVTYRNFIARYFPSGKGDPDPSTEWTDTPRSDWSGPDDDDELVDRMLKSRSARSVLGKGVTIRNLWEVDLDALAVVYPDAGGQGRPFDWSAADAALCQHLAFWTGGNCKRMERIFSTSALSQRSKWSSREAYRRDTILNAVRICQNSYKQPGSKEPVVLPESGTVDLNPGLGIRSGLQYLDPTAQIELFKDCVYVRDIHRVFTPDGGLLKQDQFRAVYGGYIFAMDSLSDKTSRNAWEAFTESQAVKFPRAIGTVFRPELTPGSMVDVAGQTYVNSYVPVVTPSIEGDASPFLDLLRRLLPDDGDRAILLAYMAACIQHIGVKFQWCPLVQGTQGNGKSFLGECLVQAIGEKYSHIPDSKDLGSVFNSWLCGNLLIIVEEVYARDKIEAIETLKWMVTNRRISVQAKGRDQITGDNRANFIMFTNHQDAIQKTQDDRRFCVFFTAQQEAADIEAAGMGGNYFSNLYTWARNGGYAIINDYLRTYAIPDVLNPATSCNRAPKTSSTDAAIVNSRGTVEQVIQEAIEEGRPGFCGGWLSSMAIQQLLEKHRLRVSTLRMRKLIMRLGYSPHPKLIGGRVNNVIPYEHGKPRLYVLNEHLNGDMASGTTIAHAYTVAQGYTASVQDSIGLVKI